MFRPLRLPQPDVHDNGSSDGSKHELQQVLSPTSYEADGDIKQVPFHQRRNSHPADRSGYYPRTLIFMIIWILFTIGVIVLHEYAVYRSTKDANPPWRLTQLPSLLMIVFAQGHTMVTGVYLGRLALSTVTDHLKGPNTWRETFWLADHSWEGPVGIVTSLSEARKKKLKLSWMYTLFVLTCVVALITPLLWERSYPQEPTIVIQQGNINASVVALKTLDQLDAYAQVGVAAGAWSSGLGVNELFNSSVYEPEKPSTSDPATPFNAEFFYAGDVQSANATLPGFKHTGGCQIVPDLGGLDTNNIITSFTSFCREKLPGSIGGNRFIAHGVPGISFNSTACTEKDWGEFLNGKEANSTNEAYFFFTTTYNDNQVGRVETSVAGLAHCKSVATTGNAYVSGVDGIYKDFKEEVSPATGANGGEPGTDPLHLLYYYLQKNLGAETERGIIRGIGFLQDNTQKSLTFHQLANEEIAKGFWRFAQHAVFATVTLHREEAQFEATIPIVVSAFNRETKYAAGAYSMLALWLVLIVGLTAVGFRKTFGDAFDAYVLTKMVLERQELVGDGTPIADSARNDKLDTPFDFRTL